MIKPSTMAASSSRNSRADALACASRAALEQSPVLVCAAIERALPSGVLGPEFPFPPCQSHLGLLLVLTAGLPHCPPVCLDFAVHGAHTELLEKAGMSDEIFGAWNMSLLAGVDS